MRNSEPAKATVELNCILFDGYGCRHPDVGFALARGKWTAHFMTKRFDREVIGGKTLKHHTQTLCAINHLDFRQRGTHDYSQLFMTASELALTTMR